MFVDSMQMMLFAGTVALALAGTYIIWGPSQNPKKKSRNAVPGLQNLGNSCFLNAILQALASCSMFITWLNTILTAEEMSKDGSSYMLSSALLTLMKELNAGSGSCSAMEVLNALRKWKWSISDEEQDAHELFHVLTTTLEEEVLDNPPVLSLLDVTKLERTTSDRQSNLGKKPFIADLKASRSMKNNLPFRGLLANQLICKQCQYKYPVKYDTFDSVSLSIPSPFWGPLKLQDCLKKFVSCEQVSDVSCDFCCKSACGSLNTFQKKTTFIKQLSFGKLPECLCFHIQRTVWRSNGIPTKCYDHLVFPEILCMDQFMCNNSVKGTKGELVQVQTKLTGGSSEAEEKLQQTQTNSELTNGNTLPIQAEIQNKRPSLLLGEKSIPTADHMYYLRAVVVHLGDLLSGHFVTYRRGPLGTSAERKWFCTSDSSTREVSFAEVSQVCAYMLYYEKIVAVK